MGRGCSAAWPPARPTGRRSSQTTTGADDRRPARDEDRSYELDGGDRPKTKRLKVRVEPAAIARLRARGPERAVSTADASSPRPGSSPATTPARRCCAPAAASSLRDAFLRLRVADGFSHARSLAFMIALVLVQATHRARRAWPAALGDTGVERGHRPRRPGPRARARPAQLLTPAVAAGAGRRRRRASTWRSCSARVGALITGHDARWVSSSGASTASTASSRTGRRCRSTAAPSFAASPPARSPPLAFVALAFGREVGDPIDNDVLATLWSWIAAGRSPSLLIAVAVDAALPLVPAPPPAGVVVAGVRRGGVGRCCWVAGHRSGSALFFPRQHLVRRHLRSAGRHRRAAAVGAAVVGRRSSSAPRSAAQLEAVRAGAARAAGRGEGRRVRARAPQPHAGRRRSMTARRRP